MPINAERHVLRQVYTECDEALEFANSQFRMNAEEFAREIHKAYKEGWTNEQISKQIHHTPTIAQHSYVVANQITNTMTAIYKAQEAMKEAQNQAELLVETIRYAKNDPEEPS